MKHLFRSTAILSLTLLLSVLTARAEQRDVQKWEGGVRVGFAMPFRTLPRTSPTLKFGEIVAEGRFNFPSTPFDIGLAIGKYPKAYTFDSPTPPQTMPQKQEMVLAAVFPTIISLKAPSSIHTWG